MQIHWELKPDNIGFHDGIFKLGVLGFYKPCLIRWQILQYSSRNIY